MGRTVLITDITSYKAVVIARFLSRNYPELSIIASDHRPLSEKLHTRYVKTVERVPCSPREGRGYAMALGEIIRRRGVDVLIPVNSDEIRTLMKHRGELQGALDYVGSLEIYQQLDSKLAFAHLLKSTGLPRPADYETVDAPLPLVVKPALGSSARGVIYLKTQGARDSYRAREEAEPADCVVQEYVVGEGVGYSGFVENGRFLVGYAHRRVAEYPVSGGSSVIRERYPYDDLPVMERLVDSVLAAAPWSGFAMFELKRRRPGDFVFIECNPRIWGSIHQGLADGANYFEPLFGAGKAPRMVGHSVRTALSPLDLLAMAGYLSKGKLKTIGDCCSGLFRTRLDINPLSDPGGYLAMLARGA